MIEARGVMSCVRRGRVLWEGLCVGGLGSRVWGEGLGSRV